MRFLAAFLGGALPFGCGFSPQGDPVPLAVPSTLFHSTMLDRKSIRDPVWTQLLDHLRRKCEEHLTPGAPEYIDGQERRAPWWGNPGTEPRQLPRAIEHLAFGGVLLEKRYGDAARSLLEMKANEWHARRSQGLTAVGHANPWLNQNTNGINLNCGTAVPSLAGGEDDTLVSFLCDASPRGGHRQHDRNHFSFYALGELFAIDNGKSLPWGRLGESHSVPLVGGGMQEGVPAVHDGINHVELSDAVSVVEGEAGDGYALAQRFTRRMALLPAADEGPPCLVVADLIVPKKEESVLAYSWLLHTHPANTIGIDGDSVTLVGGRKGNRCLVDIVASRPGQWRRDTHVDHPRLRYDWSSPRGVSVAILAPYRAGDPFPTVRRLSSENGCAMRIERGSGVDTVLCANPGTAVAYDGFETDAEFAVISIRSQRPDVIRVLRGTYLKKDGRTLALPVSGRN